MKSDSFATIQPLVFNLELIYTVTNPLKWNFPFLIYAVSFLKLPSILLYSNKRALL